MIVPGTIVPIPLELLKFNLINTSLCPPRLRSPPSIRESSDEHPGTGSTGSKALGEIPPAEGKGAAEGGETQRSPSRGGETGTGGNRPPDEVSTLPGARGEGGRPAALHPSQAGAGGRGRRAGAGAPREGSGVSKEPTAGGGRG